MKYETKSIGLNKIFLDNANPRHDPIDNEPEIISLLIAKEKVKPLARHIASLGPSPLEKLAVMPMNGKNGHYIALEGNRRVCSLKLLSDPGKCPEEHRKFFKGLRDSMSAPPLEVEAVIFPNRESADPWLSLRHEGPLGGAGIKAWNASQKTRFSKRKSTPNNPNLLALSLLDYAENQKIITSEEREKLGLTTLTRFLSNPLVRNAMGLASAKALAISTSQDEFNKVTSRFLGDALKGASSGVHSRTSKADREAYAGKLRKQGFAPDSGRFTTPIELDASTGKAVGAANPVKARNNRNPDSRRNVIPSDFAVHINNKVLKRIYDELRGLDAHEFSFAAGYLFRATVEQVARLYCKQNGIAFDRELHILLGAAADHLEGKGQRPQDLKPLRTMANDRHAHFSPETLGAFVHGGLIPSAANLNRSWDTVEACMKLMIDQLK